ncbi:hypothetical protein ANCCEY_14297, partial [Ancylostoma ceylanicum]
MPGVEKHCLNLVLKRLDAGDRLEKPRYCSQQIYDLISLCWNVNPDLRPKFSLLRTLLLGVEFNIAEVRDESRSASNESMLQMSAGDRIIVIESSTMMGVPAMVSSVADLSSTSGFPLHGASYKSSKDKAKVDLSDSFDAAAFDENFSPSKIELPDFTTCGQTTSSTALFIEQTHPGTSQISRASANVLGPLQGA